MTHEDRHEDSELEFIEIGRQVYAYELRCKTSQNSWSHQNDLGPDDATWPVSTARREAVWGAPGGGIVRHIGIWFSAGSQAFVHARVLYNGSQIIPRPDKNFDTGGLIGDDIRYPFAMNLKVKSGDTLELQYQNSDSNKHTILMTIEFEESRGLKASVMKRDKPEVHEPKKREAEPPKAEPQKEQPRITLFPGVKVPPAKDKFFEPILVDNTEEE